MHMTPPPSVLPDISPSRGEIGKTQAHSPDRNVEKGCSCCRTPISPLEGEMSGRTEGGESRSMKGRRYAH
ncbi:hypothetical protein DSM25558_3401 [Agrobacterium sp. DSM 25558]|nr:hypothetical protein DSM25558_3401 [Agrobacterium sp. DSM 25558]